MECDEFYSGHNQTPQPNSYFDEDNWQQRAHDREEQNRDKD